jgi:hypothetical protein
MLDDLQPAPKITNPPKFKPAIEFDGNEGHATTPGYATEPENFDEFLISAGLDPEGIEVIPPIRTSRWQQREGGEWLTSYRFTFRRRDTQIDLPALMAEAKKAKPITPKGGTDNALIVCPADFQVGKVGSRGDSTDLVARVMQSFTRIEDLAKATKPERIYILEMGDIIESVSNKASMNQLEGNDLSPMQQTDLAASLMFSLIKRLIKFAPITYGSVASNHCQNRVNGQQVGRPGKDDWGIVIAQQLRRLTTELEWDVNYLVPHPYDEGYAFQYGVNTVGVIHGHQAGRPDGIPVWWQKQSFANQAIGPAVSLLISAHFHHLKITELTQHYEGGSKFWVQCPTSDNGSDWYRNSGGGGDSQTGILCMTLHKDRLFKGTVVTL